MKSFRDSEGYRIIADWLHSEGKQPFDFQETTWKKYYNGYSGMVVAPTGFGKTFSVFLAVVIDSLNRPERYKDGMKLLWISPLRSLAKDLAAAMHKAVEAIGLDWAVEVRNGDTPQNVRRRQERLMPDILITTPETLHVLFSQKKNTRFFTSLRCVAVDEWHELLGSKRGVLTELALARLVELAPQLRIWGITATIGNLETAAEVLLPYPQLKTARITARQRKKTVIVPVLPDTVEVLPWAGHLGASMCSRIVPIIYKHHTTLIFTNTRNQSELWYQLLLEAAPELAGQLAIHHGSIDKVLREWIETSITEGKLRAVVCTSSLDLGVDFKPVDCVIQIGSSKGIARFMQRAGRSGHSPYEQSRIYFVPTHSLELIEVSALKEAVRTGTIEAREPMALTYDVLVQFLVTLAVGEGFREAETYAMVRTTHAFKELTPEEWQWALQFITQGGAALKAYEEFHRVVKDENGVYRVAARRISMLHRMNLGVIVSDAMLRVKFLSGGYIGMIEEYFISKLKPGDCFVLAGRNLELVKVKDMTALVRRSKAKKGLTPSWLGGRLPLSSSLSHFLRKKLSDSLRPGLRERELKFLQPLIQLQQERSHVPGPGEFLVEMIATRDGHHLFMYPFEGRLVNEVIAMVLAYRISRIRPLTFTIAVNDYGFELLSDQEIPVEADTIAGLVTKAGLMEDVRRSINASEMASRKFRDIAVIAGLVVQSRPGSQRTNKSLQSSSGLIFKVLESYEPDNLLLKQAYAEVFDHQLEAPRLYAAFDRMEKQKVCFRVLNRFSPLSFPIKVDSLRATLSSEALDKRIKRLQGERGS